jgi:hypothetical protein
MSTPAPSLKDRITEDMKAAMRARDADRLGAIRMLLAAVKQKEVDERIVADDGQVAAIVDKLIKQRRDSIAQFGQAGRTDLVEREEAEVRVLSAYLPAQATEAEIAATGPQDMGRVMGVLKARLAGRADLTRVSATVKSRLAPR